MKKIIFKDEVWAIVTARKNSKSIKRKNIVKIKGKELILYSFEELRKIKNIVHKVITSTDDEKIKKMCKRLNYDAFHRNKLLSGDFTNSVDVVLDVLSKSLNKYKFLPKIFLLIQPTSIFLRSSQIIKIVKKLNQRSKFKSAQTIIRVPHQFHAFNQRKFVNKQTSFMFEKKRMMMHNKQTKPRTFAYGNLIACKTKYFIKSKNFFTKPSYGLHISNIYGFDVDNSYDLKVINQILNKSVKSYE